jgi:hypothetical protein
MMNSTSQVKLVTQRVEMQQSLTFLNLNKQCTNAEVALQTCWRACRCNSQLLTTYLREGVVGIPLCTRDL